MISIAFRKRSCDVKIITTHAERLASTTFSSNDNKPTARRNVNTSQVARKKRKSRRPSSESLHMYILVAQWYLRIILSFARLFLEFSKAFFLLLQLVLINLINYFLVTITRLFYSNHEKVDIACNYLLIIHIFRRIYALLIGSSIVYFLSIYR